MRFVLIFILFVPFQLIAQSHPLAAFDNLMNKTWKAEGKWGDGSIFKQEITYAYSLESNIVITKTKGFVDEARKKYGERNHGIRKYNATSSQYEFWEFDVFGGTTNGTVQFKNKNIIYQYNYGGTFLTEMWEYVDDMTYNFIVGEYDSGNWNKRYLNAQFKARAISAKALLYEDLKKRISGNWTSTAWDGQLNEWWSENENGELIQKAEYIEDGIISYSASNKMELAEGELILFTIIKDGNPKIFKATTFTQKQIVFENSDYKNPSKVIYDFSGDTGFQRTISGLENDKPTSYTFKFKKTE